MNNDLIIAYIRTGVAIVVGTAISWALRHGLPVGSIDTAQAVAYVTPLCIAGYYAAVHAAERQWPQVGWLLGVAKAPLYQAGDAPAPDVPVAAEPRMVSSDPASTSKKT